MLEEGKVLYERRALLIRRVENALSRFWTMAFSDLKPFRFLLIVLLIVFVRQFLWPS